MLTLSGNPSPEDLPIHQLESQYKLRQTLEGNEKLLISLQNRTEIADKPRIVEPWG